MAQVSNENYADAQDARKLAENDPRFLELIARIFADKSEASKHNWYRTAGIVLATISMVIGILAYAEYRHYEGVSLGAKLEVFNKRITDFGDRLDKKITDLGDRLDKRITDLDKRVADLDDRLDKRITGLGDRLDDKIKNLDNRMTDMDKTLKNLKP